MARIVFIGGGIGGLIGALLLGRDGHQVTVLERDPTTPSTEPAAAFDDWSRRGVPQFRLTHVVLPRLTEILADELPDVHDALGAAGGLRTNRLRELPATITGGLRPADTRFEQLTGRRPMLEATLAGVLDREPGVIVRRGVAVTGLLAGAGRPGDVPHVAGVVLDSGERVIGDLVVATTGRRSALPAMLNAIGAPPPAEDVASHGFTYFCRTFRSPDGAQPPMFGPPLQHYESLSFVTAPADNGTWSVGVIASSTVRWIRRAAAADVVTRIVAADPLLAHWVDGEPISDVETMSATPDRRSRFVVDGRPVATGVVALGDALACTSPMYGRGMTVAAMEAVCLRDVLREVAATDASELAHRWYDRIGNVVMPLIDETIDVTCHRLAQMDAEVAGTTYDTAAATWSFAQRLFAAAPHDPEVLRAVLRVAGVFERVGDIARRADIVTRLDAIGELSAAPGPTRHELETLIDTASPPRDLETA
jgi:2-polyprenyl-6-methoxyphenol hydroxylase-like FAD-dependent oxidoreductase